MKQSRDSPAGGGRFLSGALQDVWRHGVRNRRFLFGRGWVDRKEKKFAGRRPTDCGEHITYVCLLRAPTL